MRWTAFLFLILTSTTAVAQSGKWQRSEETSALDDTRSIFWSLKAENTTPNSIGRPERPILHIMCFQKETRVLFGFNDYIAGEEAPLVYRVDKAEAKHVNVGVSEGGKVIGYWRGTGIPFLLEIENAGKLAVGAKPYNEPMREAIFKLSGIKTAIREVRAACKW